MKEEPKEGEQYIHLLNCINYNKYYNLHNFISSSHLMKAEDGYKAGVEDCLSKLENMGEKEVRELLMVALGLLDEQIKVYNEPSYLVVKQ